VRLLINTDMLRRTWRPCDIPDPHLAKASPFVEVGYLPAEEFAELERNSVEDADGWMVESPKEEK